MSIIEHSPLSGSPDRLTGRAAPNSAAARLPNVLHYLVLLGLFVSWAGFWFAVIWWIV